MVSDSLRSTGVPYARTRSRYAKSLLTVLIWTHPVTVCPLQAAIEEVANSADMLIEFVQSFR
jgi:hypothetical protein